MEQCVINGFVLDGLDGLDGMDSSTVSDKTQRMQICPR